MLGNTEPRAPDCVFLGVVRSVMACEAGLQALPFGEGPGWKLGQRWGLLSVLGVQLRGLLGS